MKEIASLNFDHDETKGQAFIFVGASPGVVGLSLGVEHDGDIDVVLPVDVAIRLRAALTSAITAAGGDKDAL